MDSWPPFAHYQANIFTRYVGEFRNVAKRQLVVFKRLYQMLARSERKQ